MIDLSIANILRRSESTMCSLNTRALTFAAKPLAQLAQKSDSTLIDFSVPLIGPQAVMTRYVTKKALPKRSTGGKNTKQSAGTGTSCFVWRGISALLKTFQFTVHKTLLILK